jgi:hypothetical protein
MEITRTNRFDMKKSIFCLQSYVFYMILALNPAICLGSINRLMFVMEIQCVF